jgi:hypothetical protein
VLPGRRVDALDPEASHVALAVATVPIRIHQRVDERLARGADELRSGAATALRLVQQALMTPMRGDAALHSCHVISPFPRAA